MKDLGSNFEAFLYLWSDPGHHWPIPALDNYMNPLFPYYNLATIHHLSVVPQIKTQRKIHIVKRDDSIHIQKLLVH
jgi:hypothetical protein